VHFEGMEPGTGPDIEPGAERVRSNGRKPRGGPRDRGNGG
jgi:hypothetical protein